MGSRGRPSAASLQVVRPASVERLVRPEAPPDLTDDQAEEWEAVVNRLPADWFPRETHPLLAQFCRHVVASRRIASMIADTESPAPDEEGNVPELDLDRWDQLLRMQEREGRALSSLATRLRITQQSTRSEKSGKGPLRPRPRPWEAK